MKKSLTSKNTLKPKKARTANFTLMLFFSFLARIGSQEIKTYNLYDGEINEVLEMPLDEIGKRAIAIREINRIRIGATNEINRLTNSGYKEVKIHHASE